MSARPLTGLQLKIMNILWDRGEASTSDVLDALNYEKDLARTTVATILTRLEKQGWITHRKDEVAHIYSPLVSRNEIRRSMVSDLVETLFKGDRTELVSHLLGDVPEDSDVIQEVMELLRTRRKGKKK